MYIKKIVPTILPLGTCGCKNANKYWQLLSQGLIGFVDFCYLFSLCPYQKIGFSRFSVFVSTRFPRISIAVSTHILLYFRHPWLQRPCVACVLKSMKSFVLMKFFGTNNRYRYRFDDYKIWAEIISRLSIPDKWIRNVLLGFYLPQRVIYPHDVQLRVLCKPHKTFGLPIHSLQ